MTYTAACDACAWGYAVAGNQFSTRRRRLARSKRSVGNGCRSQSLKGRSSWPRICHLLMRAEQTCELGSQPMRSQTACGPSRKFEGIVRAWVVGIGDGCQRPVSGARVLAVVLGGFWHFGRCPLAAPRSGPYRSSLTIALVTARSERPIFTRADAKSHGCSKTPDGSELARHA